MVIVGGGFAGLQAARSLKNKNVQITLIDKHNYHLFQPLLYQVATGGLSPGDIASPIRAVLSRQKNITIYQDEMVSVDGENREVIGHQRHYPYDYLIIAIGAKYAYFGHDGWRNHAPSLKTLQDALDMRSRILDAFERAELETDAAARKALMTFAIIGGGPTGVELAGAIGELAHATLKNNFRNINPAQVEILLLEAGPSILSGFPRKLSDKGKASLSRLGVTVRTHTRVTNITAEGISIQNDQGTQWVPCQTALWAAGVQGLKISEHLASAFGCERDRSGRLFTTPQLTAPGDDRVLFLGDMIHVKDAKGKVLPGIAPVAMQQGRYAGQYITNHMTQRDNEPFRYWNKGILAVIGRNAAVADLGTVRASGFMAWVIWAIIHIAYLIEFDNKILVMTQWAWNYFTRKRGARIISESVGSTSTDIGQTT